jgi:hypothetical protein
MQVCGKRVKQLMSCKHFEENEIRNAIFEIESSKVAGPYGLPGQFYKSCWEVMMDMNELFTLFHAVNIDHGRMSYGTITRIPKKKVQTEFNFFRPICLPNVWFKIFLKVLSIIFDNVRTKWFYIVKMLLSVVENIIDGDKKQLGVFFYKRS